jgi:multidrug efflux pump subunit AcrB
MITVVLMIAGAVSYFSLPTREDPAVTIREAVVSTQFPGMSAERVELLLTKTIEEAVRQVPEVEEIRSVSMPGTSLVHVEIYDRYFDLDQIWDEVRQKVEGVQPQLPEGTQPPRVNDDFGDVAVVTAALHAPDFDMGEMFDLSKHVRDRLYAVEGTEQVVSYGVQAERIFIETHDSRLASAGLSVDDIRTTLQDRNIVRPGGRVDDGTRSLLIEPTGNFENLDEIRNTLLPIPGSSEMIPLSDVAEVRRATVDPPTHRVLFEGNSAILLAVSMLEGHSVLDFSRRIEDRLKELAEQLPVGVSLDVVTVQARQVEEAICGVTSNVLQTVSIVLIVVVLFLGRRTGLIVGSIVPGVMLATLGIMGFFELTLERMSLATLVIALGLLVDNGIVIAEDFKRRIEEGIDRDDALQKTGNELAIPLLTSTLTTILVFLPLMLAENIAGEYTRSISLVIAISLGASWVFALCVTPILCHRFIRVDGSGKRDWSQRLFGAMTVPYERFLRTILRYRILFLLAMASLLAASVFGLKQAPKRFFPDSDRPQLMAYVDLPAGVSTRTTERTMRRVSEALQDEERFPHLRNHVTYVGFGGPRFVLALAPIDPAPNRAVMLVNLTAAQHISSSRARLQSLFDEEFPELRAQVTSMFLGPSDSTKIEVQVKGPDTRVLTDFAERVESHLRTLPGSWGRRNDWQNRVPNVVVEMDQERARRAGVSSADAARSMQRAYSGSPVTEFREGDDIFPVVTRAVEPERTRLDRLSSLAIRPRGRAGFVPLGQVADLRIRNDLARIHREDLERTVTIEARNRIMTAEDMIPLLDPFLDQLRRELPPNHAIEYDGVVVQSNDAKSALLENVPLCIGLMIILMVVQFNSYTRPLIIFGTIPLLLVGAVIGIYVMQANFGFMVLLGLYSLAGIVINNAIVLIDRIEIERNDNPEHQFEAVVSACVRRLRPIVMTTVTTILGLMPLIVARDALFYGMASVIAFGLLVGTVLTLGVVPVAYSLLFRIAPASTKGGSSRCSP